MLKLSVLASDSKRTLARPIYHSDIKGVVLPNVSMKHLTLRDKTYFRQGPVFDQFGNKAVWHGHWEGDLITYPSEDRGSIADQWKASGRSAYATLLSYSSNPCVRLSNNRGYYDIWPVLNYGPVRIMFQDDYYRRYYNISTVVNVPGRGLCPVGVAYWLQTYGTGIRSHSYSWYPADISINASPYRTLVYNTYGNRKFDDDTWKAAVQYGASIILPEVLSKAESYYSGKAPSTETAILGEVHINTRHINSRLVDVEQLGQMPNIWTSSELSGHAREVIESVNDYDSNLIAYFSDLKDAGATLRSLLSLTRDYKNPKAWASAWLSTRFGDRLTISDTKQLLKSIAEAVTHRVYTTIGRAHLEKSYSTLYDALVTQHRCSTVYVSNTNASLEQAIGAMMKWDLWPTLENTWDMIPLSFVADWFLPISQTLSQIDAAIEMPYLDVKSSMVSDKRTIALNNVAERVAGEARYVFYRRNAGPVLSHVRPFEDGLASLPSFSVANVGDALALAVQFAP